MMSLQNHHHIPNSFSQALKSQPDPKFYIALLNVDQEMDFEENDTKIFLNEQYKITQTTRLIRKKTKQPLNVIKAIISDENTYKTILLNGSIKIGYTNIKVKPWNFESQSDQCFKCLKFGHSFKNCKNEEICLRCAGKHNFKNCKITDEKNLLCSNCQGNHAACSKSCPVIIKRLENKKNKIDLTFKSEENKNKHHQAPTVSNTYRINNESSPTSFLIDQKINNAILNILKFLIFNTITASIYDDSTEFTKLIENNFGQKFNLQIQSKLAQYQEIPSEYNDESESDDLNMQYE